MPLEHPVIKTGLLEGVVIGLLLCIAGGAGRSFLMQIQLDASAKDSVLKSRYILQGREGQNNNNKQLPGQWRSW